MPSPGSLQPSPTPSQFTSQDFLDPLTPSTRLLDLKCHFLNVSVGYIINVIQDSFETALNSSGDVLFTATAEYSQWRKKGKSLPTFLGGTTVVGEEERK